MMTRRTWLCSDRPDSGINGGIFIEIGRSADKLTVLFDLTKKDPALIKNNIFSDVAWEASVFEALEYIKENLNLTKLEKSNG